MAQRIRITKRGLGGANGPIPVGTEFDLKGDMPEAFKHYAEVIGYGDTPLTGDADDGSTKGTDAPTIPTDDDLDGMTRAQLAEFINTNGGTADANDAKPNLVAAAKEAAAILRA